jgi:transcriptional regulator with XRE-family HTH domain
MTMQAVGAYFQARRKLLGLTQEEVARRLQVSTKSISEWELGRYYPSSDALAQLIALLQASAEIVQRLMIDPNATPEEGRRLAGIKQDAYAALDALTDEEFAEAMALYERLAKDPKALMRWLGYGHRLSDERREEDASG